MICCPARGVISRSVPAVDEIVFPLMLMLSTSSAVRVPSDVMDVCAAPVTVAAVPETLPVTLPVKGPEKPVAVRMPVLELNARPAFVFAARLPVAAVTKSTKQDVSVTSSATAIVAALPVIEPAIAFVTSRSVNQPFVTRDPVEAMDPVNVRLFTPSAKSPPASVSTFAPCVNVTSPPAKSMMPPDARNRSLHA